MKIVEGEITLKNGGLLMLEKGDELIHCLVRVYYDERQPTFTPIIIKKGSRCRQNLFNIDSRYVCGIDIEKGAELPEDNVVASFEGETVLSVFRPPKGEVSEMKHWRPENWEEILATEAKKIPDQKLLEGNLPQALLMFSEAGADAMLEARKELDTRICSTLCTVRLQMREAGWDAKLDSLIDQLLVILGAPYLKGGEVDSVKEAK